MQERSTSKIRTFSIGFDDEKFDEAPFAGMSTSEPSTELHVSGAQALDIVPKLPEIYDEPFSDLSQIPTVLVSQMARQHVTVSLSGDGGDEIFGGYNRYRLGEKIWARLRAIPAPVRRSLAGILSVLPETIVAAGLASLAKLSSANIESLNSEARLLQFKSMLAAQHQMEMHCACLVCSINQWLVIGGAETSNFIRQMDRCWSLPRFYRDDDGI